MSILHISLFGNMRIMHDDKPIMTNMTHITQAFMAYLLLLPHHPQPRDILADVFWGTRSQEHARRCLKTTLWRLRSVLEPEGTPPGTYLLTLPNGDIGFNWQSSHWLDVAAFEQAIHSVLTQSIESMQLHDAHNLEGAMSLYGGELLEGFYDDWALRERERLRHMYLNSLAYLMRFYRRQGLYEEALENGGRILELDPLREEIHREMMQLYVENGQRALAIKQYESCCELLASELDIMPMDETQALYAQIAPVPDHLRSPSIDAAASPYSQHVLRQLRSTLRDLKRTQDRLQQTIVLIERSSDHSPGIDRARER